MEECDQFKKACQQTRVKVAVAHRNRYHPALPVVRRLIKEGVIGKVVALRGRGKRITGEVEDLWVLGTHIFDLVHAIAGDPESCSAELRIGGRLVEKSDIKPGNEGLGPLAGDEVHARWKMKNGWTSTFDSIRGHGIKTANFGLQIIGNEGVIDLRCDREPFAHMREGCPWLPESKTEPWVPISSQGIGKPESIPISQTVQNHKSALINLIDSVERIIRPYVGWKKEFQLFGLYNPYLLLMWKMEES